MPSRFLRYFVIFFVMVGGVRAAEPTPVQSLADSLLRLSGTVAVFDSPAVQAALTSPKRFLSEPRLQERLVQEAGLKLWQPPRIWLLQERIKDGQPVWQNVANTVGSSTSRGLRFSLLAPLPSADEAIHLLQPQQVNVGLAGLLAAYEADVLVLLKGESWTVWGLPFVISGTLPSDQREALGDVLAEVLASAQQWPMARGWNVISVYGATSFGDFASVQSALQALPEVSQLQLIQAAPDRLFFAVANPLSAAFDDGMKAEPRLPALGHVAGLPDRLWQAQRLAGVIGARLWQPEMPATPSTLDTAPPSTAIKSLGGDQKNAQ